MARFNTITLLNGEQIRLTDKELLFCENYLGDQNRNATQAAIRSGYSVKTAANIANQNLGKLHIKAYIDSKTQPVLDQLGATAERLMAEWVKIGLSDVTDYLNEDYSIKNLGEVRKQATGAISEVQVDEKILMKGEDGEGQVIDRKVKFKLHDKIKALTELSKMQGVIKEGKEPEEGPKQVNNIIAQINNVYNNK